MMSQFCYFPKQWVNPIQALNVLRSTCGRDHRTSKHMGPLGPSQAWVGTASWSRPALRRLSLQVTRRKAVMEQRCLSEAMRTEWWDTCHTFAAVSSPILSFDRERNWDIQRRRGLHQSHVGPMTPKWVSSLQTLPQPDQTFHLYSSRFHELILERAACNEVMGAPIWFTFLWQGHKVHRQAAPA